MHSVVVQSVHFHFSYRYAMDVLTFLVTVGVTGENPLYNYAVFLGYDNNPKVALICCLDTRHGSEGKNQLASCMAQFMIAKSRWYQQKLETLFGNYTP